MRSLFSIFIRIIPTLILLLVFLLPILASAAPIDYVPLQPLPDQPAGNSDLKTYLIYAFKAGISVAGILSVLMLVIAGFQYSTTDAVSGKEDARGKMNNVLMGLGLILVSYILLSTVNKEAVSLNLDFGVQSVLDRGVSGDFTNGLGVLRYNRAQTLLNDQLRQANANYSNGTNGVNALTTRINALRDQLEVSDNPAAIASIEAEMNALESQKTVLNQQIESARVGAVYQTAYDNSMINMSNNGINKDGYLFAKRNFQTSEAHYLQMKATLEAGDQASRDAARQLEDRWNRQAAAYNRKRIEVETKYPTFTQGNQVYTGGNIYLPGR